MHSSLLRRSLFQRPASTVPRVAAIRSLHLSPRSPARKDAQDKDSISTGSTEYSKSGGDDAAARATDEAAFSTDKTRPEEQHESAAQESSAKGTSNPLNVSPANPDISQPRPAQEGGPEGSAGETGSGSERQRTSGGGSGPKAGGGKSG